MSAVTSATERIEQSSADLIALSHDIHAHPELGYQEFHSSNAVMTFVEAAGLRVEHDAAGLPTAFTATAGSGALRIGICAEFDALPEVGHACGHNIIAAAGAGAALGLAAVADEIDATVVLFGTPSEEGGGGKVDLINAGYFDDINVAMMVHPWPNERLDVRVLAVDHFDVIYSGRHAHASAAPWEGVNALDALTIAQVAIGLLRQQLPSGDQVHGYIVSGGVAANIIPSHAIGRFMCRSLTAEHLAALRQRVDACFLAGAQATGASIEFIEIGNQFSHMVQDEAVLAHYRASAEARGRRFEADDRGDARPTISTDMGNVSLVVPSIHPMIGIETHGAVNHQPDFTAACVTESADRAVIDGAVSLAMTGIATALDAPLRQRLLARRS